MSLTIDQFEPKLFSGAVADEIVASVNDSLAERGVCRISLAGGSTPGAIYRMLSQPPRASEIDWSKVELFWGDERWVPRTDNQSNYKMVQETLLGGLPSQPKIYGVDTGLSSPEAGAEAYSATIRSAFGIGASALPEFDLVLLGMGEDGHTASLFPGSGAVNQSGLVAVAVRHPSDGGFRVTLLPDVLFGARKILFLVKGEEKAEMLQRVIEGNEPPEVLPARLFEKARDRVSWLLDSRAGSKLSQGGR